MKKQIALVSDFDGTISPEDFFWYVANHYLDDKALEPWQRYLGGKLSHLEALNAIFAKISVPQAELDAFIKTIPIDPSFSKTAIWCFENDVPLYICSAGCDYYINLIIGDWIKKYNIKLVTNHGVYSQAEGLKMIPPSKDSPFYDSKVGISKAAVVHQLKEQGYYVIFAGDGPPDISPAKLADVVFAKKILLQECQRLQLPTLNFENFDNIYTYLKEA